MRNYRFSKKSLVALNTCHDDLQLIMKSALCRSFVDFGISEGHRSIADQRRLYAKGLSQLDGVDKKSKHNAEPSMACDIYAFVNGKAIWDKAHLCYLAGIVQMVADELFYAGVISHVVRWGGNWDGDGVIMLDQSFQDLGHFELIRL